MRLLPLLLLLVACSSAFSAPAGLRVLEVACDDLDPQNGHVEAVLVADVDPDGWTALVGYDGDWEEAEGVRVLDGDLRIDGACLPGEAIRISWW